MTNSGYTTRPEAIANEIVPALGEFVEDYDVDGIADEVLGYDGEFYVKVSVDEFYRIIDKYDISEQ